MQYTKLGFYRSFRGFGSLQVLFSLIVNRSVIPNFAYCHRYGQPKNDATMNRMQAKYIDKKGEIETEIFNDGQILKLYLNGVEFTSRFLDDFTISNSALKEKRFELNSHDELTNYKLVVKIPVRLSINSIINLTTIDCELTIKRTKDNYNETNANCNLLIENTIVETGNFNMFESGFEILNQKLPDNVRIICCYNCIFSDYSVYGQSFWGTMSCYKNIKEKYLKVQDKDEYMEIMDNYDRMVSETFYCDEFTMRIKGTGYRR